MQIISNKNQVSYEALTTVTIQANCQFYDYAIAQWQLEPYSSPRSSQPIYQIGSVGILNTGHVTLNGNQIGEVQPNPPP